MVLILFEAIFPWLIVAMGCWLGYQLVRQNGRILLRLEAIEERLATRSAALAPAAAPAAPRGLPIGSATPEFTLPDLAGEQRALGGGARQWYDD
jgi:hypothetical protein